MNLHVGMHHAPDGGLYPWLWSARWDAGDVMKAIGALYARAGEGADAGWARASKRGWAVYEIRAIMGVQ